MQLAHWSSYHCDFWAFSRKNAYISQFSVKTCIGIAEFKVFVPAAVISEVLQNLVMSPYTTSNS